MSRLPSFRRGVAFDAPRSLAPAVIAVLIGTCLALLLLGFIRHYYQHLDCSPVTFQITAGAVLLATGLGPHLLRGLTLRLAHVARGRLERKIAEESASIRSVSGVDRDLLWMATGIAGLAAGLAALSLPYLLRLGDTVLDVAYTRFLWMEAPLAVFEAVVIVAVAAVPFSLIGFFLRCSHQLACSSGRWDFAALAWALLGMALGFVAVGLFAAAGSEGVFLIRLGTAPLLIAAMVSVAKATPSVRRGTTAEWGQIVDEPEFGEHWPIVLRLALAVCVCAGVTAGLMWTYVVAAMGMGTPAMQLVAGGVLLLLVSVGVGLALRADADTDHSVGAVGVRLALGGMVLAAGVAVFNLVVRASYAPFIGSLGHWLLWLMCAGGAMSVIAYVTGFGMVAITRRGAGGADGGSRLLRWVFLASLVAIVFLTLASLERLGSYATLVAAALALLATGGILLIHEPGRSAQVSRVPVTAVFAAVILMTFLMPTVGAGWLGDVQARRGRLVESWWLTKDARHGARMADARSLLAWSFLPEDSQVGAISFLGQQWLAPPNAFAGRVERLVVDPSMSSRFRSGRTARGDRQTDRAPMPALRALRAGVERYDILTLSLADVPAGLAQRFLSPRLVASLWSRLTPDGVLAVTLPCGTDVSGRLAEFLATASYHASGPAGWATWAREGAEDLTVVCGRGSASRANADRWFLSELTVLDAGDISLAAETVRPASETANTATLANCR